MARPHERMADHPHPGHSGAVPPFDQRLAAALKRRDLMPWGVIGDRDELDDIMQDTALRALTARTKDPHAFEAPGTMERFVRVTARRLALRHVRRCEKGSAAAIGYHEAQESAARQRIDPAALVEALGTYAEAADALHELPAYLRRPWLLFKGEAVSLEEAADMCGITPQALRRYLTLGTKRLRERMHDSRRDASGAVSSDVPARKTHVPRPDDAGLDDDEEDAE